MLSLVTLRALRSHGRARSKVNLHEHTRPANHSDALIAHFKENRGVPEALMFVIDIKHLASLAPKLSSQATFAAIGGS